MSALCFVAGLALGLFLGLGIGGTMVRSQSVKEFRGQLQFVRSELRFLQNKMAGLTRQN